MPSSHKMYPAYSTCPGAWGCSQPVVRVHNRGEMWHLQWVESWRLQASSFRNTVSLQNDDKRLRRLQFEFPRQPRQTVPIRQLSTTQPSAAGRRTNVHSLYRSSVISLEKEKLRRKDKLQQKQQALAS